MSLTLQEHQKEWANLAFALLIHKAKTEGEPLRENIALIKENAAKIEPETADEAKAYVAGKVPPSLIYSVRAQNVADKLYLTVRQLEDYIGFTFMPPKPPEAPPVPMSEEAAVSLAYGELYDPEKGPLLSPAEMRALVAHLTGKTEGEGKKIVAQVLEHKALPEEAKKLIPVEVPVEPPPAAAPEPVPKKPPIPPQLIITKENVEDVLREFVKRESLKKLEEGWPLSLAHFKTKLLGLPAMKAYPAFTTLSEDPDKILNAVAMLDALKPEEPEKPPPKKITSKKKKLELLKAIDRNYYEDGAHVAGHVCKLKEPPKAVWCDFSIDPSYVKPGAEHFFSSIQGFVAVNVKDNVKEPLASKIVQMAKKDVAEVEKMAFKPPEVAAPPAPEPAEAMKPVIPILDTYSAASEPQKEVYRQLALQFKELGPEAYFKKYGISPEKGKHYHDTLVKYWTNPETDRLAFSDAYVMHKIHKLWHYHKTKGESYAEDYLSKQEQKAPWYGKPKPMKPVKLPLGCPVDMGICSQAVDNIVEWRNRGHEEFSDASLHPVKVEIGGVEKRELKRSLLDGTVRILKCAIPYAKHCKADPELVKQNEALLEALPAKIEEACKPLNGTYACDKEKAVDLLTDKDVSVNTALAKVHDMAISLIKTAGHYHGCKLAEEGKPSKHNMAYCQGAPNATLTGLNTIVQPLGVHKAEVWIEDTTEDKALVKLDYWDSVGYKSSHIRCAKVAEKMKELGMKCPIQTCPENAHQHVQCNGNLSEGDVRQMAYFLSSIVDIDTVPHDTARGLMDKAWAYSKERRDDKEAYKKTKHLA